MERDDIVKAAEIAWERDIIKDYPLPGFDKRDWDFFLEGYKSAIEDNKEKKYTALEMREIAINFFYYWWNTPGNNTYQGYDEWINTYEPTKEE